jgi:hypothetical protein
VSNRTLLILLILAGLGGLGLVVGVGAWLLLEAPFLHEARIAAHCESLPLESVTSCTAWDESFQEAYYLRAARGTPDAAVCQGLFAAQPAPGAQCRWGVGSDFSPEACPSGLPDGMECFLCTQSVAQGEEHFYWFLALQQDCGDAWVMESANVSVDDAVIEFWGERP